MLLVITTKPLLTAANSYRLLRVVRKEAAVTLVLWRRGWRLQVYLKVRCNA